MDTIKIGGFLKEIRRENGLTQEQEAEVFGVSGRTVSRWETGFNMPDLSILIQIADYYHVEIRDILDGERREVLMDEEMKKTLSKVADYSELEKKEAMKAGNTAFGLMMIICAVMIVIQLVIKCDLLSVMGETVTLLSGGVVYIGITIYQGAWEGSFVKSTIWHDALISASCAGIFSAAFVGIILNTVGKEQQAVTWGLIFFIGIAALGFVTLRVLAFMNKVRKESGIKRKNSTE